MMRLTLLIILSVNLFLSFGQNSPNWDKEKIVVTKKDHVSTILHADELFLGRWDELAQPLFWKKIMLLSPDTSLINIAETREVLMKISSKTWQAQTEPQKLAFKDSLRKAYQLDSNAVINVTTGKNDFYRFNKVYPSLTKGVAAFEKQGVDPWYAQAILLIENLAQLQKSIKGAYGAFQLMPDVARSMGIVVNDKVDERGDFDKCAYAAARLIHRICIPEAKKILNRHNIAYNTNDLWFRLFVLHVYHAGAMNVAAVVNKIQPCEGSQELILEMWRNKAAHFGAGSQNYTQLALAAQLILDEKIYIECDDIKPFEAR